VSERFDYWLERLCRPKNMTNEFEWQHFRADLVAFVVVVSVVATIAATVALVA